LALGAGGFSSASSNNIYATARDAVNPDLHESQTATAKTPIKAILIDPFEMTVSEVGYGGEMVDIYRLIDADLFTVAGFGEDGDGVYVDDEGLFKATQRFFKLDGYPQPLAGKGLVLGSNDGGESVAPVTTLEAVRASIRWVQPLSQHLWIDSVSGALLTTKELCTY
jgi:hypothetical protein